MTGEGPFSAETIGHLIKDVQISGPSLGGILVIGSVVTVDHVTIEHAGSWGVLWVNSLGSVQHSQISHTTGNPVSGFWGDGFTVLSTNDPRALNPGFRPSTLVLKHNLAEDSSCAGLSNFGSHVIFVEGTNSFILQAFDLEGEIYQRFNFRFEVEDNAKVECQTTANDEVGQCGLVSAGLAPPPPLDPPESPQP